MNISEIQAESLNQAESGGDSSTQAGGHPKLPIRSRGYHRALKRGAPWAVEKKADHDAMVATCDYLRKRLIYGPNPFFRSMTQTLEMDGLPEHLPITYGYSSSPQSTDPLPPPGTPPIANSDPEPPGCVTNK